eukprot:scaffold151216_cov20-Tisochrysis_lutea.AAC.1
MPPHLVDAFAILRTWSALHACQVDSEPSRRCAFALHNNRALLMHSMLILAFLQVGATLRHHSDKCSRHGGVWCSLRHLRQHFGEDPDLDALCGERLQGKRDEASCQTTVSDEGVVQGVHHASKRAAEAAPEL